MSDLSPSNNGVLDLEDEDKFPWGLFSDEAGNPEGVIHGERARQDFLGLYQSAEQKADGGTERMESIPKPLLAHPSFSLSQSNSSNCDVNLQDEESIFALVVPQDAHDHAQPITGKAEEAVPGEEIVSDCVAQENLGFPLEATKEFVTIGELGERNNSHEGNAIGKCQMEDASHDLEQPDDDEYEFEVHEESHDWMVSAEDDGECQMQEESNAAEKSDEEDAVLPAPHGVNLAPEHQKICEAQKGQLHSPVGSFPLKIYHPSGLVEKQADRRASGIRPIITKLSVKVRKSHQGREKRQANKNSSNHLPRQNSMPSETQAAIFRRLEGAYKVNGASAECTLLNHNQQLLKEMELIREEIVSEANIRRMRSGNSVRRLKTVSKMLEMFSHRVHQASVFFTKEKSILEKNIA